MGGAKGKGFCVGERSHRLFLQGRAHALAFQSLGIIPNRVGYNTQPYFNTQPRVIIPIVLYPAMIVLYP